MYIAGCCVKDEIHPVHLIRYWVLQYRFFRGHLPVVLQPTCLSFIYIANIQTTNWTPNYMVKLSCCSVALLCPTLCNRMDYSMPGFPVHHQLLEFTQTHVHWVSDAIQPSHPVTPSPSALNLFQQQGLFQWVGFLHQVAKVLEL